MKKLKSWVGAIVSVGCGMAYFGGARSAQAKGLAGSSRVTLKTALVAHQSVRDTTSPTGDVPVGLGLAPQSLQQTSTVFGLQGAGLGAEVGYFVTDHIGLGTGVLLTGSQSSQSGSYHTHTMSFSVLPRLEYVLGGDAVRPYLAGFGGYRHNWTSWGDSTAHSNGEGSGFSFGGALGAHVFVGRSWSVDPELTVGYSRGSSSGSYRNSPDAVAFGTEGTSRGSDVMLTLGLSGWFGVPH